MLPLLRKALPYLTIAVIAALAYDGWVFYSRWRHAQETEQTARNREASDARKTIDMLGGGELKILNFYAAPGVIRPGGQSNLCYGVNAAQTVRIEPAVKDLHPALTYCFSVAPARTTEYKLVAEDAAGKQTTASLTLQVKP
jgi:hypothetical protein